MLSMVLTLIQMMKDHAESNPTETERLRNMLGEKEVALVERAEEVNRWVRKEVDTQAKLQRQASYCNKKSKSSKSNRKS